MELNIDKKYLISEISEAFKGVELGEGIGLSQANAIDDYKDEHFQQECRKNDEKLTWYSIPSAFLNKYYSSLSFFDAEGMRFHLPAFMIATLKGEYHSDLVFSLTNLSDYSDYKKAQFSLLNKQQKKTVVSFLEYLIESPEFVYNRQDIETAIEYFWGK